jgi:hypothetical protein
VEVEFLVGVHSDGLEDVFNDLRIVEKGWTEVEFEPVTVEDFVSASDGERAFEHGHVDA